MTGAGARARLLQATLDAVGRWGIGKTSVEDVARLAGVSRATVYRYFPGGKDQLISETVTWESGRFFERLRDAVGGDTDLASQLERALVAARREIVGHAVLQKVLQTEPERLLPVLLTERSWLLGLIAGLLRPAVDAADLRDELTADEAAAHLARMVVSLVEAPAHWDLADDGDVRRVVREHLVPSVT